MPDDNVKELRAALLDDELRTMMSLWKQLEKLDFDARQRVLSWLRVDPL